jgi:hypothetical protein
MGISSDPKRLPIDNTAAGNHENSPTHLGISSHTKQLSFNTSTGNHEYTSTQPGVSSPPRRLSINNTSTGTHEITPTELGISSLQKRLSFKTAAGNPVNMLIYFRGIVKKIQLFRQM